MATKDAAKRGEVQSKARRAAASSKARRSEPGSAGAEVLQRAAECFAASGYRGTSMRAIAQHAGMMAGSLYSHFDSKLQILDELMTRYFEGLLAAQRAAFDAPGTVGDRLSLMLDALASVSSAHPEVVMVVATDWHDIVTTPELEGVVAMAREGYLLVRRLLEEGIENGEVRDDLNLDAVVRLIQGTINGLLDRRFQFTSLVGGPGHVYTGEQIADTLRAVLFSGVLIGRARTRKRPAPLPVTS